MNKEYIDVLQSFVDLTKCYISRGECQNLQADMQATEEALKYIRNTEETKRTMLKCGYYDDENIKHYVVEVDKSKLEDALKKLFNAQEIIIK